MKIKISKSQWELMGKTAGWMKVASEDEFIPVETTISEFCRNNMIGKIQLISTNIQPNVIELTYSSNDPKDIEPLTNQLKNTLHWTALGREIVLNKKDPMNPSAGSQVNKTTGYGLADRFTPEQIEMMYQQKKLPQWYLERKRG